MAQLCYGYYGRMYCPVCDTFSWTQRLEAVICKCGQAKLEGKTITGTGEAVNPLGINLIQENNFKSAVALELELNQTYLSIWVLLDSELGLL